VSNPIYKYIIKRLWEQDEANRLETLSTNDIAVKNVELRKQAQVLLSVFKKLRDLSSDWEYMDSLIVNEETKYLYKQWEIEIVSVSFVQLEYVTHILLPLISYNIIYDEPITNDLDFYNTGLELKNNFFYDMKGETLILKASVLIEKVYGTEELVVPQVKLLVDIDSSFLELH